MKILVRDTSQNVIATITGVISTSFSDRMTGERTFNFSTLMVDGLATMSETELYTVEYDNDFYDVVNIKKSLKNSLYVIELTCEHISYRLNNYKVESFSQIGSVKNILSEMLKDTGFTMASTTSSTETAYSLQKSSTVRAMLFDFASQNGFEVEFLKYTVTFVSHRGSSVESKIIDRNVIDISKTYKVSDGSVSYSLKLRPKTPISVGDEVYLKFDRLGIDERVRVLGIKTQPFISEDVTLEVGGYEPSLEAESVRVEASMIKSDTRYYGAKISTENGIEIIRGDNDAKLIFNADKMAFYQGNEEVLYFDPVARKWKMSAAVELHVTDNEGNDTTMKALSDGMYTRIEDANNHFIEISETINGLTVKTETGETLIDGGMITTDNIQLQRLIAKGSPHSYVEMLTNGLNFVLGNANTIGIGYASSDIPLPYIIFGEGASPQSDASGMIKFYDGGLWVGDSADRHSTSIQRGTGLFVDVPNDRVEVYINGTCTELTTAETISAQIQDLRNELQSKMDNFNPVATFG